MNELERMQLEIAQQNAARGQMRPPPRAVDAEGYEAPSAPPPAATQEEQRQVVDEYKAGRMDVTVAGTWLSKPVGRIDLIEKKIFGSIGTFDLTDEDIAAFTQLATQAMRRAIDAICAAPERSAAKPTTSVKVRPKKAINSAPSTKRKYGTKRGRPTKQSGAALPKVSPST